MHSSKDEAKRNITFVRVLSNTLPMPTKSSIARFTRKFNRHNILERKNRRRKKISNTTNDNKEEEGDVRNSPRKRSR